MKLNADSPTAWAWPMAASLLAMPTVYPWYLLWLTPFFTTRSTWPLLAWSVGAIATYLVWGYQLAGEGWVLPIWVVALEYGLVGGVGLWVVCTRKQFDSSIVDSV